MWRVSKNRVAVLKVVSKQLTATAAAEQYGMSRQHLQRLLARYREGGLEAVDPRSRRPKTSPQRASESVRERVIALRIELVAHGLDAGPVTIAWHLEQEGHRAPSPSTIRRILHAANLVTSEPRKRPRSSYIRFEAAQPNETWQSDFTHWRLADGSDVQILNWLDDHSRYLISCTAHQPVTGEDVVTSFLTATDTHGIPASTLTDNGRVYTARHGGGRNAFEYLLPLLGVTQKNGSPFHPQTQGKIERFHQTQKRYLASRPPAHTTAELQQQLDELRDYYNEHRPHRARDRSTPGQSYRATPKALPATGITSPGDFRIRYDQLDIKGKMSIRRAGKMHHLGIGATHARRRVIALGDHTSITVIDLVTGQVLSTHLIEPDRIYWRNQNKVPGRWPGTSNM